MHKMDPRGPKRYIFGNHACSKNARKVRFHVFLQLMLGNMILSFTWSGPNSQEIVSSNLVQVLGEPQLEQNSSKIIRVKVVAKNILYLQCDVSFWRNIQSFWTKLLHLRVFLIKQYTSLIYVKEKSFCLVNWAFPFVGPRGPFSRSKVAKTFYAY